MSPFDELSLLAPKESDTLPDEADEPSDDADEAELAAHAPTSGRQVPRGRATAAASGAKQLACD
ncbi:MAG: hypothetical protein KA711_09695 [Ideonella sp. WA131b]|nr:hypothetical protein [Ideonella sp. WA131b]